MESDSKTEYLRWMATVKPSMEDFQNELGTKYGKAKIFIEISGVLFVIASVEVAGSLTGEDLIILSAAFPVGTRTEENRIHWNHPIVDEDGEPIIEWPENLDSKEIT